MLTGGFRRKKPKHEGGDNKTISAVNRKSGYTKGLCKGRTSKPAACRR